MPDDLSLPGAPHLTEAEDYAALRALGIARITELSGLLWTHHNPPDPGITMLEAMAYAVSDLGYRTAFPMADLLTRPDGTLGPAAETGLFPAHEVLTTSPVTIPDHRRLLMRIEGVANAWLDPMTDPAVAGGYRVSETPIHADCLADALSHDAEDAAGDPTHPVLLTGLYRVLIALEIDDVLGSLNDAALKVTLRAGPLKGVVLALDRPDATGPAFEAPVLPDPLSVTEITLSNFTDVGNGVEFSADVAVDDGATRVADLTGLRVTVIEDRPRPTDNPVTITAADIEAALTDREPGGPILLFLQKQEARRRAMTTVRRVLHAHRPLSEDYLSIETVAPFRVGICGDIDLDPAADLEEVTARVLHEIELYLNPPPVFRTLDALLSDGVPTDLIFNGPYIDFGFTVEGRAVFTKPGFITDADLAACDLRRRVHVSDIINILVGLPGVVAVRNLTLRAYDAQGVALGETEFWTLDVPPRHQPVLYEEGTKLTLFKNELPYRAQPTELARTLGHLRALARSELYVAPDQVLPKPRGRWRGLDVVPSLQTDLPRVFGTGHARLPPDAGPVRVAQAHQLKAYLTFFDQLLADYLGQLAHARVMLSPDMPVIEGLTDRTWFPPHLTDIPGTLGDFADEFYLDPAAMADPLHRVRLNESEADFLDRRGRALDHLIARFAERFADHALWSVSLSGDRLATARELIDDRTAFLSAYPRLSRERGEAFNQLPEDPAEVWDSLNSSGLERRAGRLLGIEDVSVRDLHCAEVFDIFFTATQAGAQFRVQVIDDTDVVLFSSEELFPSADDALDAARPFEFRLAEAATYAIDDSAGTGAVVLRLEGGGAILTQQGTFADVNAAVDAARALVDRHNAILAEDHCGSEGMHLIEHILLRPRAPGDRLMQVCLNDDCAFCGEEDPYSFRISIVLPYWPTRFRDLNFRRYAERVLREETPAHVHARICWVDNADMAALDAAHRAWREGLAAWPRDDAALAAAAANLIDVLTALRTIYPPATLHDCDEGGDDNIVRLDATNLGYF